MVKTESLQKLQKGDIAPDFTLPGIDGRTYSLKSLAGKSGLFVLFMCNHCPYVRARMEEVVALHKEFGNEIAFVGINSSDPEYPGEGEENMKAFAKERNITFPYLLDEDGAVAKKYGATCTPDPFLFSSSERGTTLSDPPVGGESKGDFRLVFHGRIADALEPEDEVHEHTMRGVMENLIKGEPIEPWFNPSLGCSIKFRGS